MAFEFEAVRGILACPHCRCELVFTGEMLICTGADHRRSYPVTDDIPRLLPEESAELTEQEWSRVMTQHERNPQTGKALKSSPE